MLLKHLIIFFPLPRAYYNKDWVSSDSFTLDISLGCSGWLYALSVICALLQNGTIRKGILLAGDTVTKLCSPDDKSVYPLFGDAGTANAIEYALESNGIKFIFNSDGKGFETIICREGGYHTPLSALSLLPNKKDETITRRNIYLELDGMDVFSFGITKAPKSVKQLCEHFKIDKDDVGIVSFHQANKMMNDMICKKLKLPETKVPYCMDEFGNTSCASIPLVLVTKKKSSVMRNLHISPVVLVLAYPGAAYGSRPTILWCLNLLKNERIL